MAFDSMIGQHVYIGVHADGAAATAWVLANDLDTLHNGTGTPIQGMMFFSAATSQLYFWDGAGWVNYSGEIEGGVYVSEIYGSDASGDGTMGNPYQTLAHACAQQAAPDLSNFQVPLNFYLAPGNYPGDVTIPQRMIVAVRGHNCYVEGNIQWPIDPSLWVAYGLNPGSDFPCLSFALDSGEGIQDRRMAEAGVAIYPPRGFVLSSGDLVPVNINPGTDDPMPNHILTLDGVLRDEFRIANIAAGTVNPNDATKTLYLNLINSYTSGTCIIAGDPDYDVGGGWIEPNEVVVFARNADLLLYGCCQIARIEDCSYEANYTLNYKGNPFDYGRIHGGARTTNIIRSTQMKKFGSLFGINAAAAVPHTSADAIKFDRESLMQMAGTTSTFTNSFHDFDTSSPAAGFGRGWFFEESNVGTLSSVVTIPNGSSAYGAFRLLAHAYLYAQYQMPNGVVLSTTNRYRIALEPGQYRFTANLNLNVNYVDVIGLGDIPGSVEWYEDGYTVEHGAAYVALQNIRFMQPGAMADRYCMQMVDVANGCTFSRLLFQSNGAGIVRAVVIDPGVVAVGGTWLDCSTTLDGFLYGGSIAPTRMARCYAGSDSFGGWDGGSPLDITVGGVFEDCVAGLNSFAATRDGGNVALSGTLTRCVVSGYGFASTRGGVIQYTATCSATMTDCDNKTVGGGYSFGYSQRGQATASGVFVRCNSSNHSFGSSESNSGGDYGIFSGKAFDCEAGHLSFGANAAILTQSRFATGAIAERCIASYQSFGARGEFTGKARKCRASYGSFGDQLTHYRAELSECEVDGITAAAGYGPPGVFGALVRRCSFSVRSGALIAPLKINGGLAGVNQETRVFDCDLFADVHATSMDALGGGPFDVQVAHCRMRVDIDPNLTNVLADPHNLIDLNYDPTA